MAISPNSELIVELATLLKQKQLYVCTAESFTSGAIATALTSIDGSSDFFYGGFINYHPQTKIDWLGVPAKIVEQYGVVSRQVVRAMLDGCQKRSGCAVAIAASGIAGPSGDNSSLEVGTVVLGVAVGSVFQVELRHYNGDRQQVVDQATASVLQMLRQILRQ